MVADASQYHLNLLNSLVMAVARSIARAVPHGEADSRLPLAETQVIVDWGQTLSAWLTQRSEFSIDPLQLSTKIAACAWARVARRQPDDEADVLIHLEERQARLHEEHRLWHDELLGEPGKRDTEAWARRRVRADPRLRAPAALAPVSTQVHDGQRALAALDIAAIIDVGGMPVARWLVMDVARGILRSDSDGRVNRLSQQIDDQARGVLRRLYGDGEWEG